MCIIRASWEHTLSKNSLQRQSQINQQGTHISSLETQNQKLSQFLEPVLLVDAITQAVASNLNIGKNTKPDSSFRFYIGKLYFGKPCPPQLAPGVDVSLNTALTCQHCKDTGHIKDNCVKLNWQLALEKKEPGKRVASNSFTSVASWPPNHENKNLLQLRTRLQELRGIILITSMRRIWTGQYIMQPFGSN